MKRILLAVVLVALSWSCFGQDARCAAANQAIANAKPGTAMAPLYRARDECNQAVSSSISVTTQAPTWVEKPRQGGLQGLLDQKWVKIADTSDGTYSVSKPMYSDMGAAVAIKTAVELADGTQKLRFDMGIFQCSKGSGIPHSFLHEQTIKGTLAKDGDFFIDSGSGLSSGIQSIDIVKGSVLDYAAQVACL